MKHIKRWLKCHFGFHEFWHCYFQHQEDNAKHNMIHCRWCRAMFTSGVFVEGPVEKLK